MANLAGPGFSPDEAKLGTGDKWQVREICLEKKQVHKYHGGHLGNLGADPGEELYAAHSGSEITTRWKNQVCTAEEKELRVPFRPSLVL